MFSFHFDSTLKCWKCKNDNKLHCCHAIMTSISCTSFLFDISIGMLKTLLHLWKKKQNVDGERRKIHMNILLIWFFSKNFKDCKKCKMKRSIFSFKVNQNLNTKFKVLWWTILLLLPQLPFHRVCQRLWHSMGFLPIRFLFTFVHNCNNSCSTLV